MVPKRRGALPTKLKEGRIDICPGLWKLFSFVGVNIGRPLLEVMRHRYYIFVLSTKEFC